MQKIEIKTDTDEKCYNLIPDVNMCFKNKINGHKFIHTNRKEGLPLWVNDTEIELYEEVQIKEDE